MVHRQNLSELGGTKLLIRVASYMPDSTVDKIQMTSGDDRNGDLCAAFIVIRIMLAI